MPSAGQLNHLIDILKGYESTGGGEVTTDYKPLHRKIPAAKEDVSGGETRRGYQVEATVNTVFTIPYIEGISPHWRVKLLKDTADGPTLEIKAVIDRHGKMDFLELHCVDVKE